MWNKKFYAGYLQNIIITMQKEEFLRARVNIMVNIFIKLLKGHKVCNYLILCKNYLNLRTNCFFNNFVISLV